MRNLFAVTLVVTATVLSTMAQGWRHDLLLSNVLSMPGDQNQVKPGISKTGLAAFSATLRSGVGLQAFAGLTNLTQQYLGSGSHGWVKGINSLNQTAYYATDSQGNKRVMVDGHDFAADISPPSNDPNLQIDVKGVDDTGRPLWARKLGSDLRIYRGTQNLSDGKNLYDGFAWSISSAGDAIWMGETVTSGVYNEDVYKNQTILSGSQLGNNRLLRGAVINSLGHVFWAGHGSATGSYDQMYIDSNLLGSGPVNASIHPDAIGDDGHILWNWSDSNEHLIMDSTDLTMAVFGNRAYTLRPGGVLGGVGNVLWSAYDKDAKAYYVYRNTTDIASDVLGDSRVIGLMIGFDPQGRAVWGGAGSKTDGRQEVFVDNFSLSRDALGDSDYLGAIPMAVGASGQVLWYSSTSGSYSVYLSTPVPEPAIGIGAITLLLSVAWRPRRRPEGSSQIPVDSRTELNARN